MATTSTGVPEIAQRQGAPISNVGSGSATLPSPNISARQEGSALSSAMFPALAGGLLGSLSSGTGLGSSGGQSALSQVANAIKNAISGSGSGGTSSMPTGNIGSTQSLTLPAGTTQAQIDATYGTVNGQSKYQIAGVNSTTGEVIAQPNYNIGGTNLSGTGGLNFQQTAQAPADQTAGTYFQDDSGNIYDGSGNLYAIRAGNTYYVNVSQNNWVNSDTGATYTADELFGGGTGGGYDAGAVYDPAAGEYVDYGSDLYYPYDPYSGYTPSDFTTYYTPTSYEGDLSPWGQGSSQDTSYYTPIDTSIGPSWYKKGGLATPMYAEGGKVQSDGVHMADGGLMDTIFSYLTSGGIQGALAGALLSQLTSGSSSGGVNQGVDMSKVGVIQPRTTSFGTGAPNYIPYSSYREPRTSSPFNQTFSDLGVSGYTPAVSPLVAFGRNPLMKAEGGPVQPYYTYGQVVSPDDFLADGGRPLNTNVPMPDGAQNNPHVPILAGRKDYRNGSYVEGAGDGQSDDIPAMLADGEYVIDSEVVSALGNGSNKAGAKVLDEMRKNIRKHKRSGGLDSIPPKAKSPLSYMKGAK